MFVNDHILKYVYTYICICCMGRFCVTLCCSLDCVYAVWGYFVYLCAGWIVFVLYGVILCTFVLTHWNVFMLYEVILCTFVLAWLCLWCMEWLCVPLCWLDCLPCRSVLPKNRNPLHHLLHFFPWKNPHHNQRPCLDVYCTGFSIRDQNDLILFYT